MINNNYVNRAMRSVTNEFENEFEAGEFDKAAGCAACLLEECIFRGFGLTEEEFHHLANDIQIVVFKYMDIAQIRKERGQ